LKLAELENILDTIRSVAFTPKGECPLKLSPHI